MEAEEVNAPEAAEAPPAESFQEEEEEEEEAADEPPEELEEEAVPPPANSGKQSIQDDTHSIIYRLFRLMQDAGESREAGAGGRES